MEFPSAWPTATAANIGVALYGSNAADYLITECATGGTLRVKASRNGGTTATAEITTSLSAGVPYFIVYRWDTANTLLTIEAYTGTSETPAYSNTNSSASNCMPVALASSTGVRIGNKTGSIANTCYIDNVFIANSYDEPLHLYGNRNITDIDSYVSTATSFTRPFIAPVTSILSGPCSVSGTGSIE